MRTWYSVCFLFVLFCSPSKADVSPKTVSNIEMSVVALVCIGPIGSHAEQPRYFVAGSGFIVERPARFVTAAHVLRALQANALLNKCESTMSVPIFENPQSGLGWNYFPLNIPDCTIDEGMDIGICDAQSIGINSFRPLMLDDPLEYSGTAVAFTGFPLQENRPITAQAHVAGYDYVGSTPRLLLDRQAWSGSSGSPIYSANGHVIGIIFAIGTSEFTGLTFGRPSSEISKLIAIRDSTKPNTY